MRITGFITGAAILYMLIASCSGCTDSGSKQQKRRTALSVTNIKGKAKMVTTATYHIDYENGKGQQIQDSKMTEMFDEAGNETESIEYDKDGNALWKTVFKNNDHGDDTGREVYDSKGLLTARHVAKYDYKTNTCEETVYMADGSVEEKNTFKFDDDHNPKEYCAYSANGELKFRQTSSYDSKGREVEADRYKGNNLDGKDITEYNEKANAERQRHFSGDGTLIVTDTVVFDANNNKIWASQIKSGVLVDGYTRVFSYEYDGTGSWTKGTVYILKFGTERMPIEIAEREIAYY